VQINIITETIVKMNKECSICMEIKPLFVVPKCSSIYTICSCCSKSLKICPFCRDEFVIVDTLKTYKTPRVDDNRITLVKGSYKNYDIWGLVKPTVVRLGMMPLEDGYIYFIDPIKTIVETDDYTMNLLQYVIFMEEIVDIGFRGLDQTEIFVQARESLIVGLDMGIRDINTIHGTIDVSDLMEKYHELDNVRYLVYSIYQHIKRHGSKGCSYLSISKQYRMSDKHLLRLLDGMISKESIRHNSVGKYVSSIYECHPI